MPVPLILLTTFLTISATSQEPPYPRRPVAGYFSGDSKAMVGSKAMVHCDGSAADTAALQTALDTASVIQLPAATCVVRPLWVHDDTVIEFTRDTVLRAAAGYREGESLLNLVDVDHVTIHGNGGAIRMNKSEYGSGEFRHGVLIEGSRHVRVSGLTSADSGGDGFYIGPGRKRPACEDVALTECIARNNRRNGLSIVSGKDVRIEGGEFMETAGTLPEAGIDIEPDGATDRIDNVRLSGVETHHNRGGGLTVAPAGLGASEGNAISVTIEDFASHDDGGNRGGGGIRLALPSPPFCLAHGIGGEVRVSRARIDDPSAWGVAVSRWVANAPRAVFEDVTVRNPNAGGAGAADFGWSAEENAIAANAGFVVAMLAADSGAGAQRVEFRRCRVEDQRRAAGRDFFVHSSVAGAKTDVVLDGFP